jgi:alkanesulfonate monooxygenase SsuD/methylene tetrahydromethanopterin reductase-like flavin-dependent oxidoreductase (luciferase family)
MSRIGPQEHAMLSQVLSSAAIGSPESVRTALTAFMERTGADELMVTCQIFDHRYRLRSYEIAAEVASEIALADVA